MSSPVALGVALGACHPKYFDAVVDAAEALGYESVWLPEHLVLPVRMSASPIPGHDHPPVPPTTPVFDAFAYLAYLAGRTRGVRLGTHVYNIGLRHPFASARGAATVDIVSGGRFAFGVGASWLAEEWAAVGLDFADRASRVDEALDVCRRLWTEPEVEHHGRHFDFEAVAFEPKPVQRPHPPVLVGGESTAALRRAVLRGDGWLGMTHTPATAKERVEALHAALDAAGRDPDTFQIVVGGGAVSRGDLDAWTAAGVTRLIVSPWERSRDAVAGLERLARAAGLEPRS
jgi:probable F420-dependent oxidoreductase